MSQTQSSCSQLALHLSKNQAIRPCHRGVFLSGEAGTYSRRFGLSTIFFRPPKTFFGAPSGFPSGGAEAGIYSPPQDLSTVFFRASQVFFKPGSTHPVRPCRTSGAVFQSAPSGASCQQLIFREQKKEPPCCRPPSEARPCNRNFRSAAAKSLYAPLHPLLSTTF